MEKRVLISLLLVNCVTGFLVKKKLFSDIFNLNKSLSKIAHFFDDIGNLTSLNFKNDIESKEITNDNISKYVIFYLYTRKNPISPQVIYINNTRILTESNFDLKKLTHFVTHGWTNSANGSVCRLIRNAYLEHGDYNVIVIDWSKISFQGYYLASKSVLKVALYCSQLINFLQRNEMNMSMTVMAGYSLGAHIIGLAARNSNGRIGYVVGLDPALPFFYSAGPGSRISASDASYVEIIHTNVNNLGYKKNIGHADYYPNRGFRQPGCPLWDIVLGTCSHARSYKYFAESINSPIGFYGRKCNFLLRKCKGEISPMGGLDKTSKLNGIFYLTTKSSQPFAKGK